MEICNHWLTVYPLKAGIILGGLIIIIMEKKITEQIQKIKVALRDIYKDVLDVMLDIQIEIEAIRFAAHILEDGRLSEDEIKKVNSLKEQRAKLKRLLANLNFGEDN